MINDAGPPVERAAPDVTNRPVPVITRQNLVPASRTCKKRESRTPNSPIDPPIAIICMCLPFSCRESVVLAVASAAAWWSYSPLVLPSGVFVTVAFGSRLKLSTNLVFQGALCLSIPAVATAASRALRSLLPELCFPGTNPFSASVISCGEDISSSDPRIRVICRLVAGLLVPVQGRAKG